MDIRQFRNVLAVLEHGTIGRAADALHISQPALTKSIHRLEEQLQVQLFERGPRGMAPTIYGECLRQHALSLSVGLGQALMDIKALRAGSSGTVTIAMPPIIAETALPKAIAQLSVECPNLRVHIIARSAGLITSLLEGEFDFILTTPAEEQPVRELELRPLYRDRLMIVARAGHPVTAMKYPSPRDLQNFTWILPEPHNYHRTRLDRAFEAEGIAPPQPAIECSLSAVVRQLAASSNHIGIVPEVALLPPTADIVGVHLNSPFMIRSISMIWRKSQVLSPAAKRLMELIEAHCRHLEPAILQAAASSPRP